MPRENKVISDISKWVEEQGGKIYNYPVSCAFAHEGFPDKIVILPVGTFFVEVKATGEEPRPNQLAIIKQINQAGGRAFWTDSLDNFKLNLL